MLSFVPTPIGNLDDISFRALSRLQHATQFFCEDTRETKKLLRLLNKRFNVSFRADARFVPMHSHNEDEVISGLDRTIFDKPCVFVSDAGMPCISDPGAKLVRWCVQNGVEYEFLAGANAAITAFAASAAADHRFLFYGFLPHKTTERRNELEKLLKLPYPFILYESPHRIADLAALLANCAADRAVSAFKELTKLHEKRFFGTASDFAAALGKLNTKGEWTIVVQAGGGDHGDHGANAHEWLISELIKLGAPVKPLSKILARLNGEKPSVWYERLK